MANLGSLFGHLSEERSAELSAVNEYLCLFNDVPSRTTLVEHDIDLGDALPIPQCFNRVSEEKCKVMEREIKYMLDNNIEEPASESWASPCLLVDKADKSTRFCMTKPDTFPLPRIEDCVDQVGSVCFVSKFDVLKGYW